MHKASYIHKHTLTEKNFTGCCLDCEKSFKIIKKHILDFYEEIKGYDYARLLKLTNQELYRKYQLLDDITKLKGGDNLSQMILSDEQVKSKLENIRSFYRDFFDIHERDFANKILNAEDPWKIIDSFALLSRYKKLVKNQLNLVKVNQNDRVIFLGCGAFPVTLIILSKYFGIRSVGIDSDLKASKLGIDVIKKLRQENKIEIIHGNEADIANVSGNIIVVAAMALPKKRIFENLLSATSSRKDIKIFYRTYTGLRQLLHIPVKSSDIKGFVKNDEIIHSGKVNNTLVLLSREN